MDLDTCKPHAARTKPQFLEEGHGKADIGGSRVASDLRSLLPGVQHQEAFAESRKGDRHESQRCRKPFDDGRGHVGLWGKPEEAISSANKAMLLDPRNTAFPLSLQGKAYFCMERFTDAATLMERAIKLNTDRTEFAATLAAAYAHLGRDQEARSALDIYTKPWLIPANLQTVMFHFPFKNPEDADRLAMGLLKAGLSGKPSGYYKASEDYRLTGEEIKGLIFGHTQTVLWYGRNWSIKRTMDGRADFILDSKVIYSGRSWIEGDMLCNKWEKRFEGLKYYLSVFRNPEGTRQEKNEYITITDWHIQGFSIED